MQDTSCRGSGGAPQTQESPKTGGYRGLIKNISAFLNIIATEPMLPSKDLILELREAIDLTREVGYH